jgi:toxin YoeB
MTSFLIGNLIVEIIRKERFKSDCKKIKSVGFGAHEKVKDLVISISKSPRSGIGRPEQLKGYRPRIVWSRRIVGKHRLIYEIKDKEGCIVLLSCYGHYKDH